MTICVIRFSWIIPNSTYFFVNCLTDLFFSGIPLLYYYINLISSIIFHLFSGDLYLSSAIFNSFSSVFKTFCEGFFETLVILSAILLPIKSIIASSAVFWIAHSEAVFIASDVYFLALSRSFWLYCLDF